MGRGALHGCSPRARAAVAACTSVQAANVPRSAPRLAAAAPASPPRTTSVLRRRQQGGGASAREVDHQGLDVKPSACPPAMRTGAAPLRIGLMCRRPREGLVPAARASPPRDREAAESAATSTRLNDSHCGDGAARAARRRCAMTCRVRRAPRARRLASRARRLARGRRRRPAPRRPRASAAFPELATAASRSARRRPRADGLRVRSTMLDASLQRVRRAAAARPRSRRARRPRDGCAARAARRSSAAARGCMANPRRPRRPSSSSPKRCEAAAHHCLRLAWLGPPEAPSAERRALPSPCRCQRRRRRFFDFWA